MGIAWCDADCVEEAEVDLRVGGRPLLPEGMPWPHCPTAGSAMLFRSQIPLALTGLASFDDDRILSVFECHHGLDGTDGEACFAGAALLLPGDEVSLREPPPNEAFDVVLLAVGPRGGEVERLLRTVEAVLRIPCPSVVLEAVPPSIAEATLRAITAAGARATSLPSPPTRLGDIVGGRLVPFDDAIPGTRRTTLPPLDILRSEKSAAPIRGVLGSAAPAHRDHGHRCRCGAPLRLAARLLAAPTSDPRVHLGPSTVLACTACNFAKLHRDPSHRRENTDRDSLPPL